MYLFIFFIQNVSSSGSSLLYNRLQSVDRLLASQVSYCNQTHLLSAKADRPMDRQRLRGVSSTQKWRPRWGQRKRGGQNSRWIPGAILDLLYQVSSHDFPGLHLILNSHAFPYTFQLSVICVSCVLSQRFWIAAIIKIWQAQLTVHSVGGSWGRNLGRENERDGQSIWG